jgi:fatty acid desaturase
MDDFWGGAEEFGEDPFLDFPDKPEQMIDPTPASQRPARAPVPSRPVSPSANAVLVVAAIGCLVGALAFGAEFLVGVLVLGLLLMLFAVALT